MARGKLILICQFGGDFLKGDDGSMSFIGGDANALYIFNDTLFSDLKLKLAEICNMEHKSMSIKYFLPGNKRVLFSLTNDHDLKKMLACHSSAVTANVFVFGNEGFDRDALKSDICRDTRIKMAEIVERDPVAVNVDATTSSTYMDDDVRPCTRHDTELQKNSCFSSTTSSTKRRRCDEADDSVLSGDSKFTKRQRSQKDSPTIADDVENHQEISIVEKNDNDIEMLNAWKEGIDGPGQEFNNADEFRDALQKYAIANRFTYKFKKNDDNRVNGRCASEGCSWKIYAAWFPQTGSFRIKKMNKIHTCEGQSWKNTYYVKNWLVDIIMKRLQSAPCYKLKDVANEIARDFRIELNYDQVRRWIKEAKTQVVGGDEEAYNRLFLFCEKLKMNPDIIVIPSKSTDERFQRLFLSFLTTIRGFREGCRPLLFLDSTSLRSRNRECLLVASAIDGNDDFFPVAFGVVDGENNDSWIWFLEQLKSEVSISGIITFISDHNKCLHELMTRVFENAVQGYSMYHLIQSFKENVSDSDTLLNSLMDAALTTKVNVFNNCMNHIKQASQHAHDWLCKINPEYWANSMFKGERYNHITENSIKGLVELVAGVRRIPMKNKVGALLQMTVNLMNTRRAESMEWNTRLTPSKEKWLETETTKASNLKVISSSCLIFEVHNGNVNIIDLETRECSCSGWGPTSMPCVHAIAVCKHTGRTVYDFCSKYFTVDNFRLTFSKSVNLIFPKLGDEGKNAEDGENEEKPVTSRPLNHEETRKGKKGLGKTVYRCTKCKKTGHNKATCEADE